MARVWRHFGDWLSDEGGVTAALFLKGQLVLVPLFQPLAAQWFLTTEVADRLIGLDLLLLTDFAEALGDLRAQLAVADDLDVVDTATDFVRAQAAVPWVFQVGRVDVKAVAFDPGAHG